MQKEFFVPSDKMVAYVCHWDNPTSGRVRSKCQTYLVMPKLNCGCGEGTKIFFSLQPPGYCTSGQKMNMTTIMKLRLPAPRQ